MVNPQNSLSAVIGGVVAYPPRPSPSGAHLPPAPISLRRPTPSGEGEFLRIRAAARRFANVGQNCNSASLLPIPTNFRYWFFPPACASETAREVS